ASGNIQGARSTIKYGVQEGGTYAREKSSTISEEESSLSDEEIRQHEKKKSSQETDMQESYYQSSSENDDIVRKEVHSDGKFGPAKDKEDCCMSGL
ncbi:hypothetical protein OS493_033064, partial [Desmophyllum pertusum]